jgi:hypothetical protein
VLDTDTLASARSPSSSSSLVSDLRLHILPWLTGHRFFVASSSSTSSREESSICCAVLPSWLPRMPRPTRCRVTGVDDLVSVRCQEHRRLGGELSVVHSRASRRVGDHLLKLPEGRADAWGHTFRGEDCGSERASPWPCRWYSTRLSHGARRVSFMELEASRLLGFGADNKKFITYATLNCPRSI